jgi:N-acetylmuramoyl-L-alanine amidase
VRARRPLGRVIGVLLLALLSVSLMGSKRPAGLGDVRTVRTWSHPGYTRVVVELTRPVSAEIVSLKANAKAGRPDRLYVDLDGIWVGVDYKDGISVGDGLLKGVRLGQNTLRRTRLVIDLQSHEYHRIFTLQSPDRIVVDV